MKKLLLSTALGVALLANATEAKFEGGYVQGDVGYAWSTVGIKNNAIPAVTTAPVRTAVAAGTTKFNLNGANLFVTGGYGCNSGSVYLGGEGRIGYNFASAKKSLGADATAYSMKANTNWSFGVAGLVGMHASPDLLVALRLGLDYTLGKVKGDFKANPKIWYFTPGLVGKYMVASNTYVNASYEYAMAIGASGFKTGFSLDKKKTRSSTIRIGAGYLF